MKRSFFLAVAAAIAVITAGLVLVQSDLGTRFVEAQIEKLMRQRWDLAITIDTIAVDLFPPSVEVTGVRVQRTNAADGLGPETLGTLRRGRVVLRAWPSLWGRPVISHVELQELVATIPIDTLLARSTPGAETPARLPVEIKQMSLWSSDIALSYQGTVAQLQHADITFDKTREGHALAIEMDDGILSQGQQQRRFDMLLRAILTGPLEQPRTATINTGRLQLPGITVALGGTVALDGAERTQAHAEVQGPLWRLREFLPDLPSVDGDVQVHTNIWGPLHKPTLRVIGQVRNITHDGISYGDVRANAVYSDARVNIESFEIVDPRAGQLTGSGSVELHGAMRVGVVARLHDASLPHILARADLPDAWVRMSGNGDLHGEGHLRPLSLAMDVDLAVRNFQCLGESHTHAGAVPLFTLPLARIVGEIRITDTQTELRRMRIQTPAATLILSGTMSHDAATGLDLRGTSDALLLRDVSPIAGIAMDGRGPLALTVEGPYADPTVSGTLAASSLTLLEHNLGNTKGTLIYRDRVLELDRVSMQRGKGVAQGRGRLVFAADGVTTDGVLTLTDMPLAQMLETLGVHPDEAQRFDATTSGTLAITGDVRHPQGRAQLRTDALHIKGSPLGSAQLSVEFGDTTERLRAHLVLKPKQGILDTTLIWRDADTDAGQGQISLSTATTDVPLEILSPLVGDLPLAGTLSGIASLQGPPEALGGRAALQINALRVHEVTLGDTTVHAAGEAGDFVIDGTFDRGAMPLAMQLHLGATLPFSATLQLRDHELRRLYPGMPPELSAHASGSLMARGDFTEPRSIVADLRTTDATLTWGTYSVRAPEPLRVYYRARSFELDKVRLAGEGLQGVVAGTLPLDGSMTVQLSVRGSTNALLPLVPALSLARGDFSMRLFLTGTVDAIQSQGEVRIRNTELRLARMGQRVEDIDALLLILGRTLTVEHAHAKLGDGTLSVAGEMSWPTRGKTQVNLRAELDRVTVRPQPSLVATLSGSLALLNTLDAPTLTGQLRTEALRYTANIDIEELLRRSAAPLIVPDQGDNHPLSLRIGVSAPGNVLISSSVLEAELEGDVTVTGNLDRVGMLGSLSPRWARARYRDNTFEVQRATIDFVDEFRIFPRFNVVATTQACGMDIQVLVAGDPNRYTVTPSGEDKSGVVDHQDVLSCLQFGLRLRDFQGHGPADIRDARWGGLDALWTVSGMDEKVQRLLPIDVDELRLTSAWSSANKTTTPQLLVGKELTERMQLRYLQSLSEGGDQALSLEYRLTNTATFQGSWANVTDVPIGDFGLDLQLRWEFR